MLNQVHIERRVLGGFMIAILAMNLGVLLGSWKEIMAGMNDFLPFYASAQMVREGQASLLFDVTA